MAILRIRGRGRRGAILLACSFAAAILSARSASAWEPTLPKLSFRGFGTLGLVYSSEGEADYVGDPFQPKGAGHYLPVYWGVDSNLGGQVDARFGDKLSAVVQVVARHRYDNQYWPQLEWANLNYDVSPDLSVRVGRTVASPFMLSDTRLVGFAQPWVRPPIEVYGVAPVTNRDGIDAAYAFRTGKWTHELHAAYGRTSLKLPGGGNVRAKHFLEINDTIARGALTFRLGYSFGMIDLRSPSLGDLFGGLRRFGSTVATFPGLEPLGAQANDFADDYEVDDAPVSLYAIGFQYDPGRWFVMGELTHRDGSAAVVDASAWYLSAGFRVGAVTPYVTYAQLVGDEPSESDLATLGLPPPLAAAAADLNGGVDQLFRNVAPSQITASAGIRWDVRENVALKIQYDFVDLRSDTAGRLANIERDFEPGGSLHLISLSLDFVF